MFVGTPKMIPGFNNESLSIDGTAWLSGKQNVFSVDPEESKSLLSLG